MSRPRICLNMIVRNEGQVIGRCLASVRPLIDSWLIVDTGSDDGTQALVRELLGDLPGALHERPWRDFGHNRSEAIALAQAEIDADWLLFIDADDVLEIADGFVLPALTLDVYELQIHFGALHYRRYCLARAALPWRFDGVLHEHLACAQAFQPGQLDGLTLRIIGGGARSQVGHREKFLRDAQTLQQALRDQPENTRYAFYLAQSLANADEPAQALTAYDQRAAMRGGFDQETYCALLAGARIAGQLGQPVGQVMARFERAHACRPTRAEALGDLARYLREQGGHWAMARTAAERALALPSSSDELFVEREWERWRNLDEYAIAAYWLGDFSASLAACQQLLASATLPESERTRVQANLVFAQRGLGVAEGVAAPAQAAAVASQADANPLIWSAYPACPLCGSSNEQALGSWRCDGRAGWREPLPRVLDWTRCNDCGHVHTAGYWNAAGLELLFAQANVGQFAGGEVDADALRFQWAPLVRSVVNLLSPQRSLHGLPPRPRWLDFGCGNGGLVMTADEFGFEAVGLDARLAAVHALQALGYVARQGDFESLANEPGSWDVISLCDVLEHVAYPGPALDAVYAALRPGGLCVVSCPNSDCASWRLLDRAGTNPYWAEFEHHHNFSAARLSALLDAHGLTAVRYDVSTRYKACMQLLARRV